MKTKEMSTDTGAINYRKSLMGEPGCYEWTAAWLRSLRDRGCHRGAVRFAGPRRRNRVVFEVGERDRPRQRLQTCDPLGHRRVAAERVYQPGRTIILGSHRA